MSHQTRPAKAAPPSLHHRTRRHFLWQHLLPSPRAHWVCTNLAGQSRWDKEQADKRQRNTYRKQRLTAGLPYRNILSRSCYRALECVSSSGSVIPTNITASENPREPRFPGLGCYFLPLCLAPGKDVRKSTEKGKHRDSLLLEPVLSMYTG